MGDLDRPWATRGSEEARRNGAGGGYSVGELLAELTQPERTFTLQTWEELERADLDSEGVEWSIEGLVERGTLGVLYGPPGAAKTYVALDMALSIAMGEPFAERETSPGLVVYIGGEGPRAFGRRLRAWREGRDTQETSTGFLYVSDRVGLTSESNVGALAKAIETAAEGLGLDVEHLVIDTWQRHLEGDENSTTDVARACRNVFQLRDRFDCSINVLHHTGWGDGSRIRGARVLEGECDSLFAVALDEVRNVTTLTCERMRDGDKPPPLTFTGHKVELPGGAVSWYTRYDPQQKPQPKAEASLGNKEAGVLRLIRELHRGEEERMVAAGSNPSVAEVTMQMLRDQLVSRGLYGRDAQAGRALSNVLTRLREKNLIAKRGKTNMVPT